MTVVFCLPGGRTREVRVAPGTTLLEAARAGGVAVEGACGGSMACATCHVIFDETTFERLDEPSLEEDEMLDLAKDVTATSRLGCQVRLERDLDGLRVHVPASTLLDE